MIFDNDIFKFHIGRVVVDRDRTNVGHVTGFGRNVLNEVVVKVMWAGWAETSIHPANLEVV